MTLPFRPYNLGGPVLPSAHREQTMNGVPSVNRTLGLCLLVALTWGCSSRIISNSSVSAVAPALTVERFLQAANERDLTSMSRIFGSHDGPIGDTGGSFGCFWKKIGSVFGGSSCRKWTEVELQMDLIAAILAHEDYQVVSERTVPGRERQTSRLGLDMSFADGRTVRDVGFVVILASNGQWLIEVIDVGKITGGD